MNLKFKVGDRVKIVYDDTHIHSKDASAYGKEGVIVKIFANGDYHVKIGSYLHRFIEQMCKSSIEFGHDPKRFERCEVFEDIERKKPKPKVWSVS